MTTICSSRLLCVSRSDAPLMPRPLRSLKTISSQRPLLFCRITSKVSLFPDVVQSVLKLFSHLVQPTPKYSVPECRYTVPHNRCCGVKLFLLLSSLSWFFTWCSISRAHYVLAVNPCIRWLNKLGTAYDSIPRLSMEFVAFFPYIFQLLALLLEHRSGEIPSAYMVLLDPLLNPGLLENESHIPSIVRLLGAYFEANALQITSRLVSDMSVSSLSCHGNTLQRFFDFEC